METSYNTIEEKIELPLNMFTRQLLNPIQYDVTSIETAGNLKLNLLIAYRKNRYGFRFLENTGSE